jgi:hypothetical protein
METVPRIYADSDEIITVISLPSLSICFKMSQKKVIPMVKSMYKCTCYICPRIEIVGRL